MIKNYTLLGIKTILRDIALEGNVFDNKYLTFDLNGTDGYIEIEYNNYIEDHFPSDIDNEIEETATIIEAMMWEIKTMDYHHWTNSDSRELLSACIIDFFRNTFNLGIESDLHTLKPDMFNEMFEDLGYPNEYDEDELYSWKVD